MDRALITVFVSPMILDIWWLTWSEEWQVDMVFMIHPVLSLHTYTIYHQSLTWGKLLSSVNGLTDTWIHLLESYTLGLPRSEAWKTKLKNTIVFASNIYLLEYSFRCFLLLDCIRLLHVFDISNSTCQGQSGVISRASAISSHGGWVNRFA